jgi:hypothetical protein
MATIIAYQNNPIEKGEGDGWLADPVGWRHFYPHLWLVDCGQSRTGALSVTDAECRLARRFYGDGLSAIDFRPP